MRDSWLHGNHRVAQDQEIRAAADPVNGIRHIGLFGIEVGPRRSGKVSASRESHHSDAIGGDVPLLRMRTHQSDCALRVAEFDGVMIARPKPILKNERRDSLGVKPVGLLDTLIRDGEALVSTAWSDDHRCSRASLGPRTRWPIERYHRPISWRVTQRARRSLLPQRNHLGLDGETALGRGRLLRDCVLTDKACDGEDRYAVHLSHVHIKT